MTLQGGVWHLITSIQKTDAQTLLCQCVNSKDRKLNKYTRELKEIPFHVAEGVWELEYGAQIMTLLHPSLDTHPARGVWEMWLQANQH